MGYRVLIPARFASTRLPGKPLLPIAGRPMIAHVIERARQSSAEEVLVATDDARIAAVCRDLGTEVVLTGSHHRSGSDRIAEAVEQRGLPDEAIIVNLQGDEPLIPASLLDQVALALEAHPHAGMATLAYPIADRRTLFDPHLVKVVTDRTGCALYFSRAPIPWNREGFRGPGEGLPEGCPYLRHIGLYAYRVGFLRRFVTWEPAPLELAESLEQLRVLWHGGRIQVAIAVVPPGPGVDTPGDLERVAALLDGATQRGGDGPSAGPV